MPEDAEVNEVSAGYWSAWHLLTSDRQIGAMGGASRIPWSPIERYASQYGFDEWVLARMLWAMDEIYLEWMTEKQKRPDGD